MVEELCSCDGLPPHSHRIPTKTMQYDLRNPGHPVAVGFWRYDPLDVGRVAVDWKAVARAALLDP